MIPLRISTLERQILRVVMGGVFVIGVLTGCSSQLRTTIVSTSEPPKIQVSQLEPETLIVEDVIIPANHIETRLDIPVEEPARPAPRSELPAEILAESKTTMVPSAMTPFSESQASVAADESMQSLADASKTTMQASRKEIPPIYFDPEMPALPRTFEKESAPAPVVSEPKLSRRLSDDSVVMATESVEKTQPSRKEIPPIYFDPEMPALPRTFDDEEAPAHPEGSLSALTQSREALPQTAPMEELHTGVPSTSEPSATEEPIQVAKMVPQEEVIPETLEVILRDIYFDYDQFAIRDDAFQVLKANADVLSEKLVDKNIVIEGHCDERGTQSYNMVLGEARADAVKTFLKDLGVPADKIEVVSYGKDKPFCLGQTEECWQENRRAHFVLR